MRNSRGIGRLAAPLGLLFAACHSPPDNPQSPYILALGNAQDAGFPQIGARHRRARLAFDDPSRRRMTTSLLIVDPRSGKRWLIDASPDIREQVELARGHPPGRSPARPLDARPPLFDGVFLTHAHIGHYLGLAQFGREAYGATEMPVHASPRMCEFLAKNGPWDLMVQLDQLELHPLAAGEHVDLADDLSVLAIEVPHRAEYTDTLGFCIRGPSRSLLYVPDIDKWERFDAGIEAWIERVDYALLDGTFFGDGEIPGRSMRDIPHPFVEESMQRFGALNADLRSRIRFTHFNHTNPLVDPTSEARAEVRRRGFDVVEQGQRFEL